MAHTHTHTLSSHCSYTYTEIGFVFVAQCRGEAVGGILLVFFREYYVTGTSVSVFLLAERGRAIAVAVVGTMWNLNAHDID